MREPRESEKRSKRAGAMRACEKARREMRARGNILAGIIREAFAGMRLFPRASEAGEGSASGHPASRPAVEIGESPRASKAGANPTPDPRSERSDATSRLPAVKGLGGRRHWVLKGRVRDFFICASARPHESRAALCVFDSEGAAERHLESLGEAQMFLDTLERYGKNLPAWIREEALSPEAREVSSDELASILANTGVAYVAVNPPLGEGEALELLPSCNFIVSERTKTCGK